MNECGKSWRERQFEDAEFRRLYAHEEFIEEFLTNIEQEMEAQEVSQTELAKRMSCSVSNVSQLLQRTRNLTAGKMVDLAFHLGLRVSLSVDHLDGASWAAGNSAHRVARYSASGRNRTSWFLSNCDWNSLGTAGPADDSEPPEDGAPEGSRLAA